MKDKNFFITYPFSNDNPQAFHLKTIYLTSAEIVTCPHCGATKLVKNFSFDFQVNNTERAKFCGNYCPHCSELFSHLMFPFEEYIIAKSQFFDLELPDIKVLNKSKISSQISEQPISSVNRQNDDFLSFSSNTTLYVYKGTNIGCFDNHHVTEVKVRIKGIDQSEIGFYANYCHVCKKYLMKYSDYENYLKRFKLFPAKVALYDRPYKLDHFERADESPLMLNGYSVNNDDCYSDKVRHELLAFLIDHGIMTKRKVLDYLEQFIEVNGKAYRNRFALLKWQDDKEFVLSYTEKKVPVINIGTVVPYQKSH